MKQVLSIGHSTPLECSKQCHCHASCSDLNIKASGKLFPNSFYLLTGISALHLFSQTLEDPDSSTNVMISLLLKTTLISSLASRKRTVLDAIKKLATRKEFRAVVILEIKDAMIAQEGLDVVGIDSYFIRIFNHIRIFNLDRTRDSFRSRVVTTRLVATVIGRISRAPYKAVPAENAASTPPYSTTLRLFVTVFAYLLASTSLTVVATSSPRNTVLPKRRLSTRCGGIQRLTAQAQGALDQKAFFGRPVIQSITLSRNPSSSTIRCG